MFVRKVDGHPVLSTVQHRSAGDGVVVHGHPVQPGVSQVRTLSAQRDQGAVPREQPRVRLALGLGPVQPRPVDRGRVLRVGDVFRFPPVAGELAPAAPTTGLGLVGVGVGG